jgi:hypothetical protein
VELVRQVLVCQPAQSQQCRYLLRVALGAGRQLTVILKNPSMADATRRDPTVGKVEKWARHGGFGIVTYINLFAYRSPHPRTLNALTYAAAVGADNDRIIRQALTTADVVVAAWGNPNGIARARYARRIDEVLALAERSMADAAGEPCLHAVGALTHLGYPRHGLTWQTGMVLHVWKRWVTG